MPSQDKPHFRADSQCQRCGATLPHGISACWLCYEPAVSVAVDRAIDATIVDPPRTNTNWRKMTGLILATFLFVPTVMVATTIGCGLGFSLNFSAKGMNAEGARIGAAIYGGILSGAAVVFVYGVAIITLVIEWMLRNQRARPR